VAAVTLTIGVDVGGTKVAGGVVDDTGKVLVQARRDTPADDVGKTRDVIIELVTHLSEGREIEAVGIGAAGWIDAAAPPCSSPQPGLAGRARRRQRAVDTGDRGDGWQRGGLGRIRYGAARHADDSMVMFTIGTGVGGGIVLGGELLRGANGTRRRAGATCSPSRTATSAAAVGSAASSSTPAATPGPLRPGRRPARAAPRHRAAGAGQRDAEAITGPMVTAAAQGATDLLRAFAQIGRWLGTSLADAGADPRPQLLVVGGVVEAGDLLLGPTRRSFAAALAQRGRAPRRRGPPGELGNNAGVIGAADLARHL
jgi:glucokinase